MLIIAEVQELTLTCSRQVFMTNMTFDDQEPPPKRTKLSPELKGLDAHPTLLPQLDGSTSIEPQHMAMDLSKELDVGIADFITTVQAGFRGTLKKRYTDFMVNEIQPDGEVVHLRSTAIANPAPRGGGDVKVKDDPNDNEAPVETQTSSSDPAARWQKYAADNQKLSVEAADSSDQPLATDTSPVSLHSLILAPTHCPGSC